MYVVSVDTDICTGCGECANACPAQIFTIENNKAVIGNDECLGCQGCVTVCPVSAIKVDEY
jgi:NAD-dependent dihydropyrimidine dehydrogenase PreA subunit